MTNLDSASFSSGNLPQNKFSLTNTIIFVPQGQESQALVRSFNSLKLHQWIPDMLIPIPLGVAAVEQFLGTWQPRNGIKNVLVMGLAGGLAPELARGQGVVYQSCHDGERVIASDPVWSQWLSQVLGVPLVPALTSREVVTTAVAKANLYQKTGVAVVDMEGGPILQHGQALGLSVAMVRVIADTATQDLPNLSQAIEAEGSLNPYALAGAFLQKPVAAAQLIYGSLRGLAVLQQMTTRVLLALSSTGSIYA